MRVKCPLCKPRRQKRFAPGRGLRTHLETKHCLQIKNLIKNRKNGDLKYEDHLDTLANGSLRKIDAKEVQSKSRVVWIQFSKDGDIEALKLLKKNCHWDWNTKDKHGSIAEHYCAGSGQLECFKYCVSLRTRANALPCKSKKTKRNDGRFSIHWACRNNQLQLIEYILSSGWNSIKDKTYDGTEPIHLVAYQCSLPLLKHLLEEYKASIDTRNTWNCSLVHFLGLTKEREKQKIFQFCNFLFVDHKFLINDMNKEGHSIIHKAATQGNTAILEWLAENQSKFSKLSLSQALSVDNNGKSIISIAKTCGHLDFATLFTTLGFHNIGKLDLNNSNK